MAVLFPSFGSAPKRAKDPPLALVLLLNDRSWRALENVGAEAVGRSPSHRFSMRRAVRCATNLLRLCPLRQRDSVSVLRVALLSSESGSNGHSKSTKGPIQVKTANERVFGAKEVDTDEEDEEFDKELGDAILRHLEANGIPIEELSPVRLESDEGATAGVEGDDKDASLKAFVDILPNKGKALKGRFVSSDAEVDAAGEDADLDFVVDARFLQDLEEAGVDVSGLLEAGPEASSSEQESVGADESRVGAPGEFDEVDVVYDDAEHVEEDEDNREESAEELIEGNGEGASFAGAAEPEVQWMVEEFRDLEVDDDDEDDQEDEDEDEEVGGEALDDEDDDQLEDGDDPFEWIPPEPQDKAEPNAVDGPVPFDWGSSAARKVTAGAEIPVIRNQDLTVFEVVQALQANGGLNIKTVKPDPDANMCETMIFCTGLAAGHRRRLANVVVRALKNRRLKVPGKHGFEGTKNDDWMLVDGGNIVLHVLTADTRRHLNLEGHWTRNVVKIAAKELSAMTEKNFEETMDKWTKENPVPPEYLAKRLEATEDDDEKTLRRVLENARKERKLS